MYVDISSPVIELGGESKMLATRSPPRSLLKALGEVVPSEEGSGEVSETRGPA